MSLPEAVSADDLAACLGITQQRVSKLVREGVLVREGRGAYPLAENVRRYVERLRLVADGRGGEEEAANLTAERARLAREQADHTALKNAQLRRELIPATEVSARWEDVVRRVRARLLAVPSRVRARRPGFSLQDVEAVDCEVRAALEGLAETHGGNGG